jgi:hypothetical protein
MYTDELYHVGVGHDDDPPGRGSGRFEWGSGDVPYQHQFTLKSEYKKMKDDGLTDVEIAKALLGIKYYKKNGSPIYYNASDLKAELSIQKAEERKANRAKAQKLYDECHGNVSEVARRMSNDEKTWNESSVRLLLDDTISNRKDRYQNTADMIKQRINETWSEGPLDVGKNTELYLGVTENTKKTAIALLEKEGYKKYWVPVQQMGTNHKTNVMVLCPPDSTYSEAYAKRDSLQSIQEFTPDQGKTWFTPEYPKSLDSDRVMIRYAEEGGKDKDGVIEIRKGVEDVSLGKSKYAQVRIMVDDTNYMKGMAMYGNDSDFPDGIDIIYNTNKKVGTPAIDKTISIVKDSETGKYEWSNGKEVLKRCKVDAKTGKVDTENPFGALIMAGGQRHYTDQNGNDQLSTINKLREEGDWDSWSRKLASQFLSKQSIKLIDQQLDATVKSKREELDEILDLTNPVIKKKLLEEYAAGCDAGASELAAKGFKGQAFQVLLPVPSLSDNEIYAPNYKDGETVALVRYPHGGTFEIPILKVNNKSKTAKSVMGDALDAVGINPSVAETLSGADFDGDTALVIPITSNNIKIESKKRLSGLIGFEPKDLYKLDDSAPPVKNDTKQREMGKVTNLINDMSVAGASDSEIERAVKHSMVVIDSEKHHLDWQQSAKDNRISELKKTYQGRVNPETGRVNTGASTILSRASGEAWVNNRAVLQDTKKMTEKELEDWNAGKIVYRDTGETTYKLIKDTSEMTSDELKIHNAGKKVWRDTGVLKTTKVTQMDVVDDAMDLVRDKSNQKEVAYANFANSYKALANEARRESRQIKPEKVSKEAQNTYAAEVKSLNEKLVVAKKNTPKERQAQSLANKLYSQACESQPDMDKEQRSRAKGRALIKARSIVGAGKTAIEITDSEWEAIQNNAISTAKLIEIYNNTNKDKFKQRATPRKSNNASLSTGQLSRIKQMVSSGNYTRSEIAKMFGISVSYISEIVNS